MRTIVAGAVLVATLFLSPGAKAAPCAGFADVVDTDPFCTVIAWMKNRAITLGCVGDGSLYCPDQFVRRDQMAAFMYRLGVQNAFLKGGNAFGATATLGTTDNQWVDVVVNGARVMSYRPDANSPNVVGGHANNFALAGMRGQVVAGGGAAGLDCSDIETGLSNRTCGNVAANNFAVAGGGRSNIASGDSSVVAGGDGNSAKNQRSTVGGGMLNVASGIATTIVGGDFNTAGGGGATVLGGGWNSANGAFSVASGRHASADQDHCFVFSGWSTIQDFDCIGSPNVARFGADHGLSIDYSGRRPDGGGTRWVYVGDIFAGRAINTWIGAHLTDAGVWVNASSSRDAKTDFADVDVQAVLAKVAALPITTWRYMEGESEVRHIGPMAEDFHAAFGVGYGPHTIADLDARGVALAAIQGLHGMIRERDAQIDELKAELGQLRGVRAELAELRRAVGMLMTRTAADRALAARD